MSLLDLAFTIPGMATCFAALLFAGAFIEHAVKEVNWPRPRMKVAPVIVKPKATPAPQARRVLSLEDIEGLAHASLHPVMREHRIH